MLRKEITCIVCPIGCSIVVTGTEDKIESIEGNQCARGEDYAKAEFFHPERILTSTAKIEGSDEPLIPLRSNKPVPKELLAECMAEIKKLRLEAPVERYQVLIPNILGTGADIVATREGKRVG